jgi:hypothetical protein
MAPDAGEFKGWVWALVETGEGVRSVEVSDCARYGSPP